MTRLAKFTVVSKTQDFTRCVYGMGDTCVQIIVGFICQDCEHLPKFDYDWFVLSKCGQKSGWYCARS